jgi:hypothetical protein
MSTACHHLGLRGACSADFRQPTVEPGEESVQSGRGPVLDVKWTASKAAGASRRAAAGQRLRQIDGDLLFRPNEPCTSLHSPVLVLAIRPCALQRGTMRPSNLHARRAHPAGLRAASSLRHRPQRGSGTREGGVVPAAAAGFTMPVMPTDHCILGTQTPTPAPALQCPACPACIHTCTAVHVQLPAARVPRPLLRRSACWSWRPAPLSPTPTCARWRRPPRWAAAAALAPCAPAVAGVCTRLACRLQLRAGAGSGGGWGRDAWAPRGRREHHGSTQLAVQWLCIGKQPTPAARAGSCAWRATLGGTHGFGLHGHQRCGTLPARAARLQLQPVPPLPALPSVGQDTCGSTAPARPHPACAARRPCDCMQRDAVDERQLRCSSAPCS